MSTTAVDTIDVESGHLYYTPLTLSLYDGLVHGFANHLIWKCPTRQLQDWFDQNVSDNHLDIGVGTGFFLDRSKTLTPESRVALLDANALCLSRTAKRVERFSPEVIHANLAENFYENVAPFQSVSLYYLLHCLPGDVAFRKQVLGNITSAMEPGGTLFGATILGSPKPKNWSARQIIAFYNQKGIFGNDNDTIESLQDVLESQLEAVEIKKVGAVAFFTGKSR